MNASQSTNHPPQVLFQIASGRVVDLTGLSPAHSHWPDLVEGLSKLPRYICATPCVTLILAQNRCHAHDIRAVTNAIFAAAGVAGLSGKETDAQTRFDLTTRKRKPMATECRAFMSESHESDHWSLPPPFPQRLKAWSQDKAKTELRPHLAAIGLDGRA